jgi:hypothetical protein
VSLQQFGASVVTTSGHRPPIRGARSILSSADLPTLSGVSRANRLRTPDTASPSNPTITSPTRTPAVRAGPLGSTLTTMIARLSGSESDAAKVSSGRMPCKPQICAPNAAVREQLGSDALDRCHRDDKSRLPWPEYCHAKHAAFAVDDEPAFRAVTQLHALPCPPATDTIPRLAMTPSSPRPRARTIWPTRSASLIIAPAGSGRLSLRRSTATSVVGSRPANCA